MKTGKAIMVVAVAGIAAVGTVHAGYSSLAERIRATGASSWAGSQSSSYSENAAGKCYVSSSRADAGYSSLADKIRANGAIDGVNTRSLSSYANAAGVYSSSEPAGMSSGLESSADYSCYDGIVSKKKVSGPSYSFDEEEMPADGGTAGKNELVLVADDDDVGSATDDGAADRNEPVFVVYDAGATTDDTSDKTTIANPGLSTYNSILAGQKHNSFHSQVTQRINNSDTVNKAYDELTRNLSVNYGIDTSGSMVLGHKSNVKMSSLTKWADDEYQSLCSGARNTTRNNSKLIKQRNDWKNLGHIGWATY